MQIANYFQLDFKCSYDESAGGYYGKANYKDGQQTKIELNTEDFAQYIYHEKAEPIFLRATTLASEIMGG